MKHLFNTVIIFLVLFTTSISAQNSTNIEKFNYIVSTVKIEQLKPIMETAIALKKEDADKYGDFQVIIYGKTVKELTNNENMEKIIKEANSANVKLLVCNMALKKFEVDSKNIPQEFEVVDNAFTHILQMQKQGYLSIQL